MRELISSKFSSLWILTLDSNPPRTVRCGSDGIWYGSLFSLLKPLKINLRFGSEALIDDTVAFITEQGRMKYVRPLYRYVRLESL